MQASLRAEGHGVPAKGLTGTGYEGHYFWDTEAYLLPFLTHTSPEVARSLLMHRIRMLPDARRRAREVGCSGALFPWRTINGEEASANYEAGTAQYHIDADIAYALDQYAHVAGDTDLMFRHGVELLVETARMWADLGFFSHRHGGNFVIHKVTGPDEYSTVVDNNLYTNVMAAHNLRAAADWVDRLQASSALDFRQLVERTRLGPDEPATWRRAAEHMYIPYDQQAGVHLQDDRFLDQAPWDFAGTPADRYPLLLHYHPLVIYRHQVIKQTDVVFATVLLPERFSAEERRRIFEYYDPMTTGDSSLSECIQAIAAADAGKYRSAEEYLVDAVALDIADTAGNCGTAFMWLRREAPGWRSCTASPATGGVPATSRPCSRPGRADCTFRCRSRARSSTSTSPRTRSSTRCDQGSRSRCATTAPSSPRQREHPCHSPATTEPATPAHPETSGRHGL